MKLVLFAALVAACAAAPSRSYAAPEQRSLQPATARILEESSERIGQDGFAFRFLSENNILRQEESRDGTVFGSYSYTSPEGVEVSVRYVADALGFRAESDALPTPVPTEYPTPEVPVTEAEVRAVQSYTAPKAEVRAVEVYTTPETEVRAEVRADGSYSAPEKDVEAVRRFTAQEFDVRTEESYTAPEVEFRAEQSFTAPEAEVRAVEGFSAPEAEVRAVQVYTAPEAEVRVVEAYTAPEAEVRAEGVYSAPEAEVRAEEVEVRTEQSYTTASETELRVPPVRFERVIVGYRPRYQG
ncbi:Cuticle protein 3 [Amphibalanus amphitrite]|uniref:Cuticle protein 3 n=1 Tax=Amphibalanus amphitrite TaxID=1232801 RepID=A0A6A4VHJ9_AMPAM|nr:cuticle protein 3-like [Amphibalanus amphitrite]KAF0289828.1 Cuticle protein 3 [Amphibalanus amphitrite]